MAISNGRKSESKVLRRYIGVAPVTIVAVNPTKKELSEIYNTEIEAEPSYVKEMEVGPEGQRKSVPSARIDIIVRTVEESCDGADVISRMSFLLTRVMRTGKEGTKVQVIDKYGRTAWVTSEQLQNHEIPMYSNGPANLDKDYRPCYSGEENLTNFLRTYLNIPSVMRYNQKTGQWSLSDHPEECEARLDEIEKYFKGDFTEIRNAMALQPGNRVKVLFGVRSGTDGASFQDIFRERVLRSNVTDYSRLDAEVKERQTAGAYPDTVFEVCDLKPYEPVPTNFERGSGDIKNDVDLPWNQFNK